MPEHPVNGNEIPAPIPSATPSAPPEAEDGPRRGDGQTRLVTAPVYLAVGALGLTMGLYTGWSSSPVVGSLITGVFGLLSGGLLALFALRPQEPKDSGKPVHDPASLEAVARSLIVICATTVLGTVLGINVRNGSMSALFHKEEQLTPIEKTHPDLPPSVMVKLCMLQRTLDQVGVERKENNAITARLAGDLKNEMPGQDDIKRIHQDYRYFADLLRLINANEDYLSKLPEAGWSDPTQIKPITGEKSGPRDLALLAKEIKTPGDRAERILRGMLYYPYDQGSAEKRLDFLFEKTYLGGTLPKKDMAPRDSPTNSSFYDR